MAVGTVLVLSWGCLAGLVAATTSSPLGVDRLGDSALHVAAFRLSSYRSSRSPGAGRIWAVYATSHQAGAFKLSEVRAVLNRRLTALRVTGARTYDLRGDVVVSMPATSHGRPARSLLQEISQTGQLLFRPGLCYAPPYQPPSSTTPAPVENAAALPSSCTPASQLVTANLSGTIGSANGVYYNVAPDPALAIYRSTLPSADTSTATVLLPMVGAEDRMLLGPALLTGRIVQPGSATAQMQAGQWVVDMSLTLSGSTGWDDMTREYFHEIIGIELDGVVQSAPITQPIQSVWSSFDGEVQITGTFTRQSAQAMALALNYGALPLHLGLVRVESVQPR